MTDKIFQSRQASTAEIRTQTRELLDSVKKGEGGILWTFHGKIQGVILPPQGGSIMLKAYEHGECSTEDIQRAASFVLERIENMESPPSLVEILGMMVSEMSFLEELRTRNFTSSENNK